ncbi:hypothetical protein A2Y83_02065 [Candidatus Falkowbacteria bacterium RBG_13_39_14]|uniref:Uncharacterized protein n=1 Tax=Candidatus Falkowbacteria bacterium RBG_13_39_14 TaxID=1797985 RepID=A0A1F5S886_9BACT|nr:MAG: hypothetical protein A2Y83_02065 [Candidatus Falkowbacteria bacterium RBG_13_39_14]
MGGFKMVDIKAIKVALNIVRPIAEKLKDCGADNHDLPAEKAIPKIDQNLASMARAILERELNIEPGDTTSFSCKANKAKDLADTFNILIQLAERFVAEYEKVD